MPKSENTPRTTFLSSLDRCKESASFIPAFYDHFLNSSDEVRQKFKNTDFEQQEHMLLRSLELTAMAVSGDPAGLRELRDRSETHDRHHLNIEPWFYELWLQSIIQTARDFDPQWTEDIENAWRTILGHVITHMVAHY